MSSRILALVSISVRALRSLRAQLVLVALTTIALSFAARAQCLDWRNFPWMPVPYEASVLSMAVHDDGSGAALYLGHAGGIRKWNGAVYSNVGSGLLGPVYALCIFDAGTGPQLYAAGNFTLAGVTEFIARWDGISWHALASAPPGTARALCVFDDGTGPALFVGGTFTPGGGAPIDSIRKWNGLAWSSLAGGLTGAWSGYNPFVAALAVFDDGSGPALYAGGYFNTAGVPNTTNIARWNGTNWSALSNSSAIGPVGALLAWDDGSGPSLFIAGSIGTQLNATGVARWNSSGLFPVGPNDYFPGSCLAVFDDGGGPKLYAASNSNYDFLIRRWDGSAWTTLQPSFHWGCSGSHRAIHAFCVYDEGSGPHLFCGADIDNFGLNRTALARLEGTEWARVGTKPTGLSGVVRAFAVHDEGAGPELYAAGAFCEADNVDVGNVARWDGSAWRSVGGPQPYGDYSNGVYTLADYDSGSGPKLYVAGWRSEIYRLEGGNWSFVGFAPLTSDDIFAFQVFDAGSGPELYIGGVFTTMNTLAVQTLSPNIVRWNGTAFLPLGSGPGTGANAAVRAMTTFNDGSGNALFAGGGFTSANGVPLNRIGRWNGTQWSPLGSGLNGEVRVLTHFDDGSGLALYAGGDFTTAGGVPANHIARWNGTSWSAVGAGLDGAVLSFGVFDDGSGPKLYAGGAFATSGSIGVNHIACWNGSSWTNLGDGIDGGVFAIASHDDGTGIGASLFVGGIFTHAGTLPSQYFAAWRSCGTNPISKFCFGDGSVAVCPCGNQGLDNRGCENSHLTGGARLNATGSVNPDSISLHVAGELPHAPTLFFQGTNISTNAVVFGSGLRCVNGSLKRLYTLNASNGSATIPPAGQPSISARSASLGDVLVPGSVRGYQAWYRDPETTFCQGQFGGAWNLSNAVRIVW